jgi:hypothetical protein
MRARRPINPHAYTVVEMLATIAALVIALGLLLSLTRHVRASSADELTKDLLRRLDQAMARYISLQGALPPVEPLIEGSQSAKEDAALAQRAEVNNLKVVQILQSCKLLPAGGFDDLPVFYFDGRIVRDAWGSPIVFMATMHPDIGMAAKGWFFFSAGPDRKYTTKSDNLYSYELPGLDQSGP